MRDMLFRLGLGFSVGLCAVKEVVAGGEPASLGVVARVNADVIDAREFAEAQQRLRLTVPEEAARAAAALDACIRSHLVRQLAVADGLLAQSSEEALRQAHQVENQARSQRVALHQVVYGPVQLPWESFRGSTLDRVERALKQRWVQRHPPAEGELAAFYSAHPQDFTPQGKSTPVAFEKCRDVVERKWTERAFEVWVNSTRAAGMISVVRGAAVESVDRRGSH